MILIGSISEQEHLPVTPILTTNGHAIIFDVLGPSGGVDPLDVSWYVQFVYKSSGVGPCNPCGCTAYPSDCPTYP
ncbi:hypothetical protein ACFLQW_04500 [Candidatus Zixiibacteriota bacterium]